MSLNLSVLDQSPVRDGGTPAQAVAETVQLAQAVEALGYRRYWVAEHHASAGFAGAAPEILIGGIAAATKTLRVGSGGVMLSHYASLKVAEQFRMLDALHPGRIDLGIGRAPGSDQRTAMALAHGSSMRRTEHFPHQVADLVSYLENDLPEGHPFHGVVAMPAGETIPDVWLLGSSDQSAMMAAYFGRPFSFAHFIAGDAVEIMDAYRSDYRPSARHPEPRGSLGVFVICAETDEEAERLAVCRRLWRLRRERSPEIPAFPSDDEALAHVFTDQEKATIARNARREFVGSPQSLKPRLEALAGAHGVDELVVLTITYSFAARVRSYELLAEAFGLTPPA